MKIDYSGVLRKLGYHLLFSLFFTLYLAAPDWIYSFINPGYGFIVNVKELGAFFAISFLTLMIRSLWVKAAIFGAFTLFSLAELVHFSYFGVLISPYAIPLMVTQAHDIGESFIALLGFIYAPFLIVAMISAPVVFALLKYDQKWEGKTFTVRYIGWFLTLILLIIPFRAHQDESSYLFQPKLDSFSAKNFTMAVSLLVGKELPAIVFGGEVKNFAKYEALPLVATPPADNIIVVMGESLGYSRMSMFGFELPTTPLMDEMVKSGELVARKALSSGVQTDVSVPSFFTLKREPENTRALFDTTSNLFALAKQRGYKTHYISAQSSGIVGGFIGKYADVIITKEDYEKNTSGIVYDQVLADYLKTVDLSKPNFIVLHQRNSHGPYDKYTPKEFFVFPYNKDDMHDFNIKTYANSIRYTDFLLTTMVKTLQTRSTLPFTFYGTSDHGELMGEEGRYGHAQLYFDVCKVPFLFTHKNGDKAIVSDVKGFRDGVTHYEIGKTIAKNIGFTIKNPNENGEYYLNGVDINGRGGFIIYRPEKLPTKL